MSLTKPTLSNLRAAGTTVGDVHFPQTELMLPLDGSNGATATSDLSDNNHSLTFGGNTQISTAQSKFGGSSLYFDGSGDYISIPSSSAFAFGTANFTIECWVRRTSTGTYPYIFDFRIGGANAVVGYVYLTHLDSYKPTYATSNANRITSSVAFAIDTWHHFALVRSSGTTTMYVDGSSAGSFSDSASYIAAPLRIGDYGGGGYSLSGYMDDWRITRGVARYTSSFTPPTTAHLTSAGDVNKQILINSTADGVAIGTGGINQARIAKVWVNFNGTGTVAIRDSYNVSSITDSGTGDYDINFTTSMNDTNYSAVGGGPCTVGDHISVLGFTDYTTSNVRLLTVRLSTDLVIDDTHVSAAIFGN